MGNVLDVCPVVSQVKSLVQVIGGDEEGARLTQENFSRQLPVVSQVRSLVEVATGDVEAARETQRQFGEGMSDLADGIPVVGHVKGGIHYAFGDSVGGACAMKAASRTAGVIGGGAGGFLVGGPVGAVAGGIAGGAAVDSMTTGIDSAVHREYRPAGTIANVKGLIENPDDPWMWFDTLGTIVLDGVTGGVVGTSLGKGIKQAARNSKKGGLRGPSRTGDLVKRGGRAARRGGEAKSSVMNATLIVARLSLAPGGGGGGGRKKNPTVTEEEEKAWLTAADKILQKMKDKKDSSVSMPTTIKELKSFLEHIGYKFNRNAKGSHRIYKFEKEEKFRDFLKEMGQGSVAYFSVAEELTVAGNTPHTLEGIVKQAFGLARGKTADHIKYLWFPN